MAISTTACLAGTAATFILLAVARRAAPMFRSYRRVVLGLDTIDTDAATATSGTVATLPKNHGKPGSDKHSVTTDPPFSATSTSGWLRGRSTTTPRHNNDG